MLWSRGEMTDSGRSACGQQCGDGRSAGLSPGLQGFVARFLWSSCPKLSFQGQTPRHQTPLCSPARPFLPPVWIQGVLVTKGPVAFCRSQCSLPSPRAGLGWALLLLPLSCRWGSSAGQAAGPPRLRRSSAPPRNGFALTFGTQSGPLQTGPNPRQQDRAVVAVVKTHRALGLNLSPSPAGHSTHLPEPWDSYL